MGLKMEEEGKASALHLEGGGRSSVSHGFEDGGGRSSFSKDMKDGGGRSSFNLGLEDGGGHRPSMSYDSGYVESKLRLETNKAVQNIHIIPNTYGAKDSDLAVQWSFGFSIKKNENQKIRIDLSDNIQDFFDYLYDSAGSTFKEGMTTDFKYCRKSQLSECLDAKVLPPTRKRAERKNNETTNEREALLETINFFSDYKHFVVVRAKAPTKEELHEWTEHVESKLGNLVIQLKNNDVVQNTYMNPKSYEVKHFDLTVQWFLGFQMKKPVGKKIDLSDAIQNFSDNLYGSAGSAFKQGMTTEFRYIKRNQLSECLDAQILQPLILNFAWNMNSPIDCLFSPKSLGGFLGGFRELQQTLISLCTSVLYISGIYRHSCLVALSLQLPPQKRHTL